jgi:2,4-dienoyl-CoA reductase-like NADH-dependent reductase (Old Yellow Enzyme family)
MSDQQVCSTFEPVEFMGLNLPNRFIRSATMEGMASTDGIPGPKLKDLYQAVAKGGAGLISTSGCLPDPNWSVGPQRQLMLHAGTDRSAWEEFTRAIHSHGALVSLQMSPFMRIGDRWVGPSEYRPGVHALTTDEVDLIVSLYARMAALVRRVGFDAVQVHAGHGYGLAQFLSPYFNRRDDAYGGSAENRARILVRIRKAIGENAGDEFPVWIKMNSFDGVPGGLIPDQAAEYAPILEEAGYGAIEVTGGAIGGSHDSRGALDKNQWFEGYYLEGAAKVKAATHLPVSAVGGIRKPDMIERILSEGVADMISLSRPLIREPDLVHRWAKGDKAPARCISCNGCFKMMMKGKGLFCVQEQDAHDHEKPWT